MKTIKKAIVIFLSVVLLLGIACGCSDNGELKINMPTDISEDDANWSIISESEIILTNNAVKFQMNSKTAHFTLTDLINGKSYSSVPTEDVFSFSEEDAQRLRSEITLTYYQKQSAAEYMYSARDSVDNGNYKILTNGEAIRVYYNFGATADEFFAPTFFTKNDFEMLDLDKLSNPNAVRRISRYYTLYENENSAEDYDEKLQKYPALKKTPLYIIESGAEDNVLEEITQFMQEVGYTEEQYQKTIEKYSIEIGINDKAGFIIPVEYSLCPDGFSAKILSDKIVESSDNYKLQKVEFLEYFASKNQKSTGSYMIPDGSGSLIKINGSHKTDYSQNFYGSDYSVLEDSKQQLLENLMLPVFSICEDDGGILAIVERGAEIAELNIKTMSNAAPQNHIFTSFALRAVDVTDIGEKIGVPVYNIFSKKLIKISPTIRFVLFSEGEADFANMAKYYRNYLIENEQINQADIKGDVPLYLDYLCMIKKPSSVMGISYDKKIVLSTIEEIIESVKEFNKKGIKNIVLRLKGYGGGGLTNKANNRFEIDSAVGTVNELKQLEDLLKKNGGALYLDADFQFVYSLGNGFSKKNSSAHYLNRAVVYKGSYDIVTRKYNSEHLPKYFVTPTLYNVYSKGFLNDVNKKLSNSFKVSFGSAGLYLGSDYASKKDMNRTESLYCLKKALKETNIKAMFDNGNAYILPFAETLFGVPLTSSMSDMEYMRIPFYQMVVHSSLVYSGMPVNLSQTPKQHYLRTLEYGAALSATLITRENSLLTNTDYDSIYYSVNYDGQLDSISKMYNASKKAMQLVQNAELIGYEKLSDEVYCSFYSNGIKILVNYGKTEAKALGTRVEAESFMLIEE